MQINTIPYWTGRLPVTGARLALLFSASVGTAFAMMLDVGFLLVLAAVAAREVIAAKNCNLAIVIAVALLGGASALDHFEAQGWAVPEGLGWRAGLAIVLMLVALIGGRIIPSFTRNWLVKQGHQSSLPGQPDRFDKLALACLAAALAGWAATPDHWGVAALLLVAALLHAVRLVRWTGHRTIADPLVLILHVAYAWLPIGLLLLGLSILDPALPRTSALHALTADAMGTMTLAVMTRATLGHTGRALRADLPTVAIYALVTFGAAVRVAAPLLPIDYLLAVEAAGLLWGGAFGLFVLAYGP